MTKSNIDNSDGLGISTDNIHSQESNQAVFVNS